jgi:hypothetical protein
MGDYDGVERLFAKPDLETALRMQEAKAVEKINSLDAHYLLKVSESDLAQSLESEFRVEPLQLQRDAISAEGPREVEIVYSGSRAFEYGEDRVKLKGFELRVIVPFQGDPVLLLLRTPVFDFSHPRAKIVGHELHFEYRDVQIDPAAIKKDYEYALSRIEQYIQRGQDVVKAYNERIGSVITAAIKQRRAKLLQNMQAMDALGIPIRRRDMPATYAVPTVRRKPKIELPSIPAGPYTAEPTLATEDYEFILKVVQDMALVMERSPSAFVRMEEEHLRDHFLVQLNGHFEGAATGETFNAGGKTDILIRSENRNVFIAECKVWRGDKGFMGAIDQLLGYTSWRDTKTAILVFNRNTDMTRVLGKICDLVKGHPNYKRDLGRPNETQFRFILGQKDDPNREIILTVMVFAVPVDEPERDEPDAAQGV